MPRFYDAIDLEWDINGDFVVDEIGDLKATDDDTIQSLIAEVRSILLSDYYDWEKHPGYAANLKEYVGEPNQPETAKQIEGRISSALHTNKVVDRSDLYVRVVPVQHDELLVVMSIQAIPTPQNSLDESGSTTLAFSLNLTTGATMLVTPAEDARRNVNLVPLRY